MEHIRCFAEIDLTDVARVGGKNAAPPSHGEPRMTTPLGNVALGSVATHVVARCKTPVLIIR